ncbi:MAG: Lipopolysaccharide core biosynthesis protein RfaG [Syntrophorhabdus sp. PtaU1.Bin002]|nr:MAG: Lipopolysaccharide core biosynthesis protein RfaG [Syntrophorhabdus sp. PtaU1.Bin002]
MNIGLAIHNFDPKKGGAERYAYDLSASLLRRGHQVYVFCARAVNLRGATIARFDTARFPRWLRSLTFALGHRTHSKAFPLDVMLGFGNTLTLDVYQSHGGVQRVWMEREIASYDDPREKRIKGALLRRSLNQRVQRWIEEYPIRKGKYSRIVAISDMVKGHMMKHYGLGENLFDVVYNGVDTEKFSPAPAETRRDETRKILFSAGNFRLKGLSPLLQSLGEIAKETKDFQLVVLGRGRQERYADLIDRLKLTGLVTFLGETSTPEEVYSEAYILAHPTFYDACSLTTMEAMASGLPTITTKWNGASALIGPGEGYVIDDPSDTTGLSEAIRALFDRDRRDEMGKKARQKLEGYTMERNVDMMEAIFQEVYDTKAK